MTPDRAAAGRAALLRREGVVAIIVNGAISIGFFFLVFGFSAVSRAALALDFLPQTFGITMLGGVVPSFITLGRIRRGDVVPAGTPPTRARQAWRVFGVAMVAMPVLGGGAALLLIALAPATLSPLHSLLLKALYGSAVGLIVTPPIIRMALAMPMFPARSTLVSAAGSR